MRHVPFCKNVNGYTRFVGFCGSPPDEDSGGWSPPDEDSGGGGVEAGLPWKFVDNDA